jgi:hypothetical protein
MGSSPADAKTCQLLGTKRMPESTSVPTFDDFLRLPQELQSHVVKIFFMVLVESNKMVWFIRERAQHKLQSRKEFWRALDLRRVSRLFDSVGYRALLGETTFALHRNVPRLYAALRERQKEIHYITYPLCWISMRGLKAMTSLTGLTKLTLMTWSPATTQHGIEKHIQDELAKLRPKLLKGASLQRKIEKMFKTIGVEFNTVDFTPSEELTQTCGTHYLGDLQWEVVSFCVTTAKMSTPEQDDEGGGRAL